MIKRILQFPETITIRLLRLRNKYPPLFVVGAPRSGTTVVIQHIINSLQFGYFPNISKKHPRACVFFAALGRIRYRYEPSYKSRNGIIEGPMSPSDGWDIFHRWFPRYDHSRPVRSDRLYELRNIVRMLEIIFRAPFANKNNANGPRIDFLAQVFPDAIWVFVKRDIVDTVFSVLESRKQNGIGPDEWWGVAPPQFFDREFETEQHRVVYQTWGVNKAIEASLERIPINRRLTIEYESFCDRPNDVIDRIGEEYRRIGVNLVRHRATATSFVRSRKEVPDRRAREEEIGVIVANIEKDQKSV